MGQRVLNEYLEGTASGTTADAYSTALTLDSRSFNAGTIVIKNTHSTNVLTYKITGYANYAGTVGIADVSAADINGAASITYERTAAKPRGKIVVEVKSKVTSTPATFTVEYIQVA
jgi:hypothetical protein